MTRERSKQSLRQGLLNMDVEEESETQWVGMEVVLDLKLLWWRLEVWEIPEFTNGFFAFPKGLFK